MRAVAVCHDEVGKLVCRAQVRVGEQIDLDEVALRLPDRGEIVVALEAACTSPGERFRAARRSGSIHTRMASGWPPSTVTRCTPGMVESCGCSVRMSQSVIAGTLRSVEVKLT